MYTFRISLFLFIMSDYNHKKKVVILTGAGISAESGINTFRDADGLWEGHDVMEVASPQGWRNNKSLVLDFYNQRRRQLHEVEPNDGHKALVQLEDHFDTHIITQNVDNLHECAGSTQIVHLHGELFKVRSEYDDNYILDWEDDLTEEDKDPQGHGLRPHIVWFGEAVPMLEKAIASIHDADIVIIIGTSMVVYPAAGLVGYAPQDAEIYYIDPKPNISLELSTRKGLKIIAELASTGVPKVVSELISRKS